MGLGSNFVAFLFLSFKRNITRARFLRAQRARACVVVLFVVRVLFSDICLYISKREKEREKEIGCLLMCVWVRDLDRERKERKGVPPTKQLKNTDKRQRQRRRDNRIFFQEGRCGYLGLIFFNSFFFCSSLFVVVFTDKNVFYYCKHQSQKQLIGFFPNETIYRAKKRAIV